MHDKNGDSNRTPRATSAAEVGDKPRPLAERVPPNKKHEPKRPPMRDTADFGAGNGSGEPRYATYGPDGKLENRTYGRDDEGKGR